MKVTVAILLIIAFITPAFGQDGRKVLAENIRSTDKIVKGAPFSGEVISESVQILADGNRITRRTVSRLYRDSEGRFRREDMPKQLGLPGVIVEMPESITITDPVTAIRYSLNPKDHTFRQLEFRQAIELKRRLEERERRQAQVLARQAQVEKTQEINPNGQIVNGPQPKRPEAIAERKVEFERQREEIKEQTVEINGVPKIAVKVEQCEPKDSCDPNSKTESLGVQNIEGVQAEGTRTTTTILAGAIGNELPIEVVYERWYSPELQLVVFSKHSDPRFGVQTYHLTNINRSEPPINLFSPPADYRPAEEKPAKPPAPPVNKLLPASPFLKVPPAVKKTPTEPVEVKKT